MDPKEIVQKLSSFPNRACAGPYEKPILAFLTSLFEDKKSHLEEFKTPKNYLIIVAWLIIGISFGLIISLFWPTIGFSMTIFFGISALLYFNWQSSPAVLLPPLSKSNNLIVKDLHQKRKKVILMAHWDTSPISLLYSPALVGNFRSSLKLSMALIALAIILSFSKLILSSFLINLSIYSLIAYFLVQCVVASIDFFRYGYSNGASDNATGVAAAIKTAEQLWSLNLAKVEVELVITGAEEVGMIGAKAYYDIHKNEFNENTFLINFDTLGAGDLKVISKTGSWSNIVYESVLTEIAQEIVIKKSDLKHVKQGAWHTADFDSVWFQRAGIQSLTLAALDKNGRMPNIHRETDVIVNVDYKPMYDAINLGIEIGLVLNELE